jgi:hypothetical protein
MLKGKNINWDLYVNYKDKLSLPLNPTTSRVRNMYDISLQQPSCGAFPHSGSWKQ